MDKIDRIDEKYIDDLDKSDEISKMVKLNKIWQLDKINLKRHN